MSDAGQYRLFNEGYFNGSDYDPAIDTDRLRGQIRDIYDLMKDGRWRTLEEISQLTKHPQASVSAQLRHLRKERFGSCFALFSIPSMCGG